MLVVSAAPVHLPGRLGLVEHPHWLPPSHPPLGFPVLLVLQDASHGEGFPFYKHPPPPKQPNTSDQVTVMLAVWSWCKISVHRERFSFIRLQVIQQFRGRCSSKFWLLHVLSQILLHHEEETGKQQPATLTFYTFSMGLASIWSLSPFSPLFLSHALRLINTCKVKWHAGSGQ